MNNDLVGAADDIVASMQSLSAFLDQGRVEGHFEIECHDSAGVELWRGSFDNLVTTVGKNALLDAALAGSGYTAAVIMGLISSASFSAVAAADTMSSHAGWLEAGNANSPHYSGTRATLAFSGASGGVKQTSANASFVFTNSGTVQGAFNVFGAGALTTIDNTGGTLLSAGTLGTPQPVIATNTVTVGYTLTLT